MTAWDTQGKLSRFQKTNSDQTSKTVQINQLTGSVNAQNSSEIENSFNEFFASVGTKIVSNLTIIDKNEPIQSATHSMFVRDTNEGEITEMIANLQHKNSSGFDEINNKLLKSRSPILLPYLFHLNNLSLCQGIFLHLSKVTKGIPLGQGGDKTEVNTYRPISLLSSTNKLSERVMLKRLYSYAEIMELKYKERFRFRNNRSTINALAQLTEKLRFDNDALVNSGVLCDFKESLDSLDLLLLAIKLESYGVRRVPYSRLRSHFCKRYKCVFVNGIFYQCLRVDYGVPQESLLGPLLFL